jgi:hypothetical protein
MKSNPVTAYDLVGLDVDALKPAATLAKKAERETASLLPTRNKSGKLNPFVAPITKAVSDTENGLPLQAIVGDTDADFELFEQEFNEALNVTNLPKDIREAATNLDKGNCRTLVRFYYITQGTRIQMQNQHAAYLRISEEMGVEPKVEAHEFLLSQVAKLEVIIKNILDVFTRNVDICVWARTNSGIGPVIAAGIYAYVDIEKAQSAASIYKYSGMAANQEGRVKGAKINYNPEMKRLMWLIGQGFNRLNVDKEASYYKRIYADRKAYAKSLNDSGAYAEKAKKLLTDKKWADNVTSEKLKEGKLSDGHLHNQSLRYASKRFISHWFQVYWEMHFNKPIPAPWQFTHAVEGMKHVHFEAPPLWNSPWLPRIVGCDISPSGKRLVFIPKITLDGNEEYTYSDNRSRIVVSKPVVRVKAGSSKSADAEGSSNLEVTKGTIKLS